MDHDSAVQAVENLATDIDFIDLSVAEVIIAFKQARKKGVRGGHVHDLLHAAAADKAGAHELLTLDENDFHGLPNKAKVIVV
jgi:predicted nucleic acid-binding protein